MGRLSFRGLKHDGFLKIHEAFYPCEVFDMSLTGARLRFDLPIDLPSNFSLQLTRDGKCLRPCSLIWSDDCEASVLFQAPQPKK